MRYLLDTNILIFFFTDKEYLHQAGITIVPINEKNLETYANLPLYDGHTDPNDRLIIAQAISDKLPLISSDLKFALYTKNKLLFVRNKR